MTKAGEGQPARIHFGEVEAAESGMVVTQAVPPAAAGWPFQASRWEVPPGRTSELDQHDVAEVWLVRSGQGTVMSGGSEMPIRAGEMVFMASRVPHQVRNTGTDQLRMFSVWWPSGPAPDGAP
jgi:mannose-6-phosphate isomerase-like protein (cupin superfamily)